MEEQVKEPAVRAKLTAENTALFETVEDYLLWAAQISTFQQFDQFFRQAKGEGSAIGFFREARGWFYRDKVEAVLIRTLCTDGRTLFEVMREQGNKKPR